MRQGMKYSCQRGANNSCQLGIWVPPEFSKRIRALAKEKGITISYLGQQLMRLGLEKYEQQPEVEIVQRSTVDLLTGS